MKRLSSLVLSATMIASSTVHADNVITQTEVTNSESRQTVMSTVIVDQKPVLVEILKIEDPAVLISTLVRLNPVARQSIVGYLEAEAGLVDQQILELKGEIEKAQTYALHNQGIQTVSITASWGLMLVGGASLIGNIALIAKTSKGDNELIRGLANWKSVLSLTAIIASFGVEKLINTLEVPVGDLDQLKKEVESLQTSIRKERAIIGALKAIDNASALPRR